MTKPLYIYGQSGHGKVLADIAKACGYAPIEFIDDDPQKRGVLRFDDALHVSTPVALGIGHNTIKKKHFMRMLEEYIKP